MSNEDKLSIRFDLKGNDYDMWKFIARERNVKYGNQLFLILLKEEFDRLKVKTSKDDSKSMGVVA